MRRLKRLTDPFIFGVTITVIYLGTIAYETLVVSASANWVENNKLNSLGDFLAGVFAPVAFLWLVVTVFLQKQELALTRQEMVNTRNVMIDQAAEAKAQKEFIEQQTAIMKRQADLAEQTYIKNRKLQMYEKRIEFHNELRKFTERPLWDFVDGKLYYQFVHLGYKISYLFAADEALGDWIQEMLTIVQEAMERQEASEDLLEQWAGLVLPSMYDDMLGKYLELED